MSNRMVLSIVADANPALQALNQVQKNLDRFMASADAVGQSLGSGVNRALDAFTNFSKGGANAAGILAGSFAAAAAGAVALTASAGRQVEALDQLSQKTGISLRSLQGWSVAMAENGIQADSMTAAMRTLSKQIGAARDPASQAAAEFEEVGIAIDGLSSTESVLRALSDRFAGMADGPEKVNLGVKFLGKGFLELLPLLNKGSKALDESEAASKRFGAQLNDLQNASIKDADDALDRFGVAANSLKLNLASIFAPAVQKGAELFAEVLGVLSHWAREVDTALDTLAIRITHLGLAAKELGKVLFSKDVIDTNAWKQAMDNIALIDKEATKLIEKRRALADVETLQAPPVQVTANTGLTAEQLKQEALGRKLLAQHLHQLTLIKAEQNAQEALGKTVGDIAMREFNERNKAFGLMVQEEERVRLLNEELSKPPNSGPFVEAIEKKEAAVRNLMNIMPELTREEAILLATENEIAANQAIAASTEAWDHRNDALEMAVDHAKVLDEAQQAMFQTEGVLFGNSENAIRARMQLIEAEGALRKRTIEESIFDEKKRTAALENLDIELDTKRQQAIQAYPSFFAQQMQAIVQSNSFSISQITTTWTSGLANAAVNGGNFVEQAWKSTQVAVLQEALNLGIQLIAREALTASVRLGIISSAAAAEMGINTAKNATIVAGDAAAATATTSIWAGAGAAITGTFAAITGAISGFFTETLIPMFATIGDILMTFLSSIAAAASATIFGIPYAVAILAGVAIIGAAIGALMAFAFVDGGIVMGPTLGMVGEAGSSEAVIPLNKRGAAFMRDAFGGSGGQGGPVTINVELDGRPIAKSVADHLPSVLRLRGVSA